MYQIVPSLTTIHQYCTDVASVAQRFIAKYSEIHVNLIQYQEFRIK